MDKIKIAAVAEPLLAAGLVWRHIGMSVINGTLAIATLAAVAAYGTPPDFKRVKARGKLKNNYALKTLNDLKRGVNYAAFAVNTVTAQILPTLLFQRRN